jgi:hypothetical protein
MSTSQPTYPARRAFVVQIHVEANVAQNDVWGRVEHIVSGQVTHFRTFEALVQFIVQVLTTKAP